MKNEKTTGRNSHGQFLRNTLSTITILLSVMIFGGVSVLAQFTFMGDYDKTFAASLGYYIDPQNPVAPATDTNDTHFYTGELLPDGSIIAGGNHGDVNLRGDFYMRKFTASGAVDTSFGTGGFVRTNFYAGLEGAVGRDTAQVLKVQPDGKILFAGQCEVRQPNPFPSFPFGFDACIMRYNANGTLDQSFGGGALVYNANGAETLPLDPGKVIFQTGIIGNGRSYGTDGIYYDMAIQPDGKIVLVGETRDRLPPFNQNQPAGSARIGAIIVRLNSNGSLDTTFGSNGIARWAAPEALPDCPTYYQPRRFNAVRLQPDGRIVAVGYNSTHDCGGASATGNRFVVTRWTAAGQLETVRHFDNRTAYEFQDERATSVHLTRDASKILVSGSYLNQSGTPAGRQKTTMIRLNIGDLSLDTSLGNGGIAQYNRASNGSGNAILNVKAIQPDGRIIGIDNDSNGSIVRFNPDGSSDQSFGNRSIDDSTTLTRGRLRVTITHQGFLIPIDAGHILVRPNGRINLVGRVGDLTFGIGRAVVSQQNTVFENGVYSDFTNDGRTDVGVFRPSSGAWFYLNSANNQSNSVAFGQAGDKPVPADYDGDGKTDVAVFRNGIWYLQQSTKGFAGISFGTTGDLPRPGDFDGDGLADIAVFRPSTGIWYILRSSDNQFYGVAFGQSGDVPLLADFDADGKSDIAVYRSGIWYYIRSSDNGFRGVAFGASGDVPVAGDYDGDSQTDIAVFRPSTGVWYTSQNPANNYGAVQFGQAGDIPVPGDYDNDGRNDPAVYRSGIWYVLKSADNSFSGTAYGAPSDVPVPAAYLP